MSRLEDSKMNAFWLVLVALLILALVGGLPIHGYSVSWGYGPSGLIGAALIVIIVLAILGRI